MPLQTQYPESNVASLEFASATRMHESLVATAEKRALIWLAKRIPSRVTPDVLTIIGFVSQCGAGLCYVLARVNPDALLLGIVCLALNWLGDSLDGTLARLRNQERPRYGFYVDHIADTIAAFFLMGGLALSGYVHPAVAMGMLVAFLMLSIETYLATYSLGQFELSHLNFGPTEIRILLACGNVALLRHSRLTLFGHRMLLFDLGGAIAIVGMGLMLIVCTVNHTVRLYSKERLS